MKLTIFSTAFLMCSMGFAAEVKYLGDITFNVNSNVRAVSFVGNVDQGGTKASANIEGQTLKDVKFSIAATAFKTGLEVRDEHLRDKVLVGEELTFVSKNSCEGLSEGKSCLLKGDLKIGKSTKEVEIELKGDEAYNQLVGEKIISLSEFDIPAPTYMGVKIKNDVVVTFKLSKGK
jgi:hypothetical protein